MESLSIYAPNHWNIFLAIASFAVVVMAVNTSQVRQPNDDETDGVGGKRRKRRSPRSKQDRGLPNIALLRDMAQAFLSKQRQLWPKLAQLGILSKPGIMSATDLADQFAKRFREGSTQPVDSLKIDKHCKAIAGAYVRFSCDKSNPRSLVQQLNLILDRAKANDHFIPWNLVFADAAISATTASHRRGYIMAKEAIADSESPLEILYIDEMGRASRDAVESLRLGRLISSRGKRLLGVSDSFDSDSEMSKMHLSMFAMVQEWFVDQLKSKVNRGMRDAFFRGTNLRPPAYGYRLVPAIDGDGKPIRGRDGSQCKMLAIDESEAKYVRLAFQLYARGKSRNAIARYFNRRQLGNQTWDASRLKQFFERYKYIGIHVENMTFREVDIDDEGNEVRVTKARPRSEWRVRRATDIQIVSWTLWKKVQRRLAESHEAYRKQNNGPRNRSDVNPTTLVRPICGSCGKPMWLGKSGKYASFTCLNGREGKHRCKHRGYKSVKIVETAILEYVDKTILTDTRIEKLVDAANAYLREEAAKPTTDTSAWKSELKALSAKRDKLADVVESEDGQDLNVLINRLRGYEVEIRELQAAIREAEGQMKPPAKLAIESVIAHLSPLRDLLQRDIPTAARILREITGPIVVRLEKEEGRRSAIWYADFSVNLVPVMLDLSRDASCPSARTWEYLNTRSWTVPQTAEVSLAPTPNYERIAAEAGRFAEAARQSGNPISVNTIAHALGTSWHIVRDALKFVETGERPHAKPDLRQRDRTNTQSDKPRCAVDKSEVVRLREGENWSFERIAKKFRVTPSTATRWYDELRPVAVRQAAEAGEVPCRGRWRNIPKEKIDQIQQLLEAGNLNPSGIAKKVGVSLQTVYRERNRTEKQ